LSVPAWLAARCSHRYRERFALTRKTYVITKILPADGTKAARFQDGDFGISRLVYKGG